MKWLQKNWVWLLMNLLAILPLFTVFSLCSVDLSGNGPLVTIDYPARMKEAGVLLDRSPLWFPIHLTGEWAIRWLTLCLSITPLTILFGWKQKTRYRKLFGLYAFVYSGLHLIFFMVDKGILAMFDELNLVLGLAATLIMIALAATSNRWSIRTLKKRWKSLHRGVYPAAILVILHVVMLEKGSWMLYAVVLAIGFILRIPHVKNFVIGLRKRNGKTLVQA